MGLSLPSHQHAMRTQREIENSFASNAGLVHHQVIKTDEGRKRYADLVSYQYSLPKKWVMIIRPDLAG